MSLFTPDAVPGRPYWWEDVAWPTLDAALPENTDLLVIGAGYTGLSAAIAAHDNGARVVVIDSGTPGQGASSRNGGMLGAHPRLGWDVLAKQYGPSAADALFLEAGEALDWVKSMIATEAIDCDLNLTGRLQLAYTKAQHEAQKRLADQVSQKGGVPCRILSQTEIAAEISTSLYKGGMMFPDHAAVHPAKFLLGLLGAALRRGIPVLGHCPAMKMVDLKAGMRVLTPHGEIMSQKIVLATNGYTGVQFPWFRRRVFPIPSFLIATEPLDPDLIKALAPGKRMMVETRARHSYFRISPDGTRIIFGGRAALVQIGLTKAAGRLRESMLGIWDALSDAKLSHVWTGNTGYSFGHMPHLGQRGRVHYAMGYSGGGTVLAPWLGRKAALAALGLPEGQSAYSAPRLTARWYYKGGRPVFLDAANLWYRHIIDRRDDRDHRKD